MAPTREVDPGGCFAEYTALEVDNPLNESDRQASSAWNCGGNSYFDECLLKAGKAGGAP